MGSETRPRRSVELEWVRARGYPAEARPWLRVKPREGENSCGSQRCGAGVREGHGDRGARSGHADMSCASLTLLCGLHKSHSELLSMKLMNQRLLNKRRIHLSFSMGSVRPQLVVGVLRPGLGVEFA